MFPHTKEESILIKNGYRHIAGIDEAGRGSWAGPVVAAAVIMPPDHFDGGRKKHLQCVRDSKLVSPKMRERLFEEIMGSCLSFGVGVVGCRMIDDVNIYQATKIAMKKAVSACEYKPDFILLDAMTLESAISQKAIIRGDTNIYSIACASIIAKVTRDRMMIELHEKYPEYGFDAHKGYGTKMHMEALKKHGPCTIHRFSYKPIIKIQNML